MAKIHSPTLRIRGQIQLSAPRQLIVVCDAATSPRRMAYGYVTTAGHYGAGADPYLPSGHGYAKDHATTSELRAAAAALLSIPPELADLPVQLRLDNQAALQFIRTWTQNTAAPTFPAGYNAIYRSSGSKPTLLRLYEHLQDRPVTVRHVKAHTGDPLNELADSLAKAALRTRRRTDIPALREFAALAATARLNDYLADQRPNDAV